MFEARDGRAPRQRGTVVGRQTRGAKFEPRVVAQTVRVLAIPMVAADLVDSLRQNIIRMAAVTLMATVRQGRSKIGPRSAFAKAADLRGRVDVARAFFLSARIKIPIPF